MIDDPELRELFAAESEAHLRALEDGLLSLDLDPTNAALIDSVFRAAHSLKGGARVLGLADVEMAAYDMEEALGAVRRGAALLTSETLDDLSRALEGLYRLVDQAVHSGSAVAASVEPLVPVSIVSVATAALPRPQKPRSEADRSLREDLAALRDEWEAELDARRTLLHDAGPVWQEHAAYAGLLQLLEQEQARLDRFGGLLARTPPSADARLETPPGRKTILVAEDSNTTRAQERRILEAAGYLVITAVDGIDALEKLGAGAIDAVVSDVEMPNMDGWTLVRRIRASLQHRDLPIVLVTSLSSDEDRRRGAEVGANAYITKGDFAPETFLESLRALL